VRKWESKGSVAAKVGNGNSAGNVLKVARNGAHRSGSNGEAANVGVVVVGQEMTVTANSRVPGQPSEEYRPLREIYSSHGASCPPTPLEDGPTPPASVEGNAKPGGIIQRCEFCTICRSARCGEEPEFRWRCAEPQNTVPRQITLPTVRNSRVRPNRWLNSEVRHQRQRPVHMSKKMWCGVNR